MLECIKCFLNLSERKRRKELDRITEKGAVGGKMTPEERAFLHHETMKHVSYCKDTIEDLRKSLEHEKKYGPGSVVFLPNGIMNPETGKPVVTIAEYLRVLEREEAEEQAQKEGVEL